MRCALLLGLVLAAGSFLPGCASVPTEATTDACLMTAPRLTRGLMVEGHIDLTWKLVSRTELFERCTGDPPPELSLYGCTFVDEVKHSAVIYLDNVIGFGEGCKLMQLGHEVDHAMGAGHTSKYIR